MSNKIKLEEGSSVRLGMYVYRILAITDEYVRADCIGNFDGIPPDQLVLRIFSTPLVISPVSLTSSLATESQLYACPRHTASMK